MAINKPRQTPAYYRWYHRKSWKVLRTNKLRKTPYCEECDRNHTITVASEVDHIEPHKGDTVKFYNEDNLQSLCEPCHSRKTMIENNPGVRPRPLIGVDGWPKK